jgi:hypothetical protein
MNISKEEAERSLAAIEETSLKTRLAAAQAAAPILILWGAIWTVAFGIQQYFPHLANRAWLVLDIAGGLLTWRMCLHKPAVKSTHDRRMLLALLIMFCYAILWAWLLAPFNFRHFGGYIISVIMCAYVIAGLWLSKFFIFLGIGVTILVILGALFLHRYESLWLALAGGGSMIGSGLYLRGLGNRA